MDIKDEQVEQLVQGQSAVLEELREIRSKLVSIDRFVTALFIGGVIGYLISRFT